MIFSIGGKIFFGAMRNEDRDVRNFSEVASRPKNSSLLSPHSSDFMEPHLRRLSPILGVVDLEVREEGGRLLLEEADQRDGAATNLQLRALAPSQLEHRPPRASISGHDDFRLGG